MLNIIFGLLVAALVGYLAGSFMGLKNKWYINIILGLVGGVVGSLVFGLLGLNDTNIIGRIIIDVVGAIIVIYIYKKLK